MRRTLVPLAISIAWAFPLAAAPAPSLLDILSDELQRNFTTLKQKADPPPYYMDYTVTDEESQSVTAMMGTLESQGKRHLRVLDITLRVGAPELDNYHQVNGQRGRFTRGDVLPLDDVPDAIRRKVWLDTDRTYRAASRRLIEIKSNQETKVKEADSSADFSAEPPSVYQEPPPPMGNVDSEWVKRVKKWSADVANSPDVLYSNVNLSVARVSKYMVSTEGTRLLHGRDFASLSMVARGKATDGMDLMALEDFQAADPSHLPPQAVLDQAATRVGEKLSKLVQADAVEPFVGPAILSGRAAAVFFHEIFGHRIEGHRQKDEGEGQTFTKSVGMPVLPSFLSVMFDPTRRTLGGVDLNGYYSYDDEGVKARPVTVVDNGVLKTFLMSRSPIQGVEHSNGHGRRQPGLEVVSRQSNLIVQSTKQVSDQALREMLIAEIKRQNKPYGLLFDEVTGGYTTTQRRGLQAFTVIPLMVYRVYTDGRPDQLVRGVDIVGTPLASFSKILATSDKPEVFNGYCGAESGQVPVSASSPALLVSEIEIQKKQHSQDRPPFLGRPVDLGVSQ
ncbi:MAG TPA: metallopeptidase TldD-related protein [Bryobacteraceae bacterium]|nr:metallopeptidase TldD-related protein [Bryobacteraceae bacterium]